MSDAAAAHSVQPKAWFQPSAYSTYVADAFRSLDRAGQRELVDRLLVLPRHIHRLAVQGLIADGVKA